MTSQTRRTKVTKIGQNPITSDRSADKPERAGPNHGMFMMRCHDDQTSCRMDRLLPSVCLNALILWEASVSWLYIRKMEGLVLTLVSFFFLYGFDGGRSIHTTTTTHLQSNQTPQQLISPSHLRANSKHMIRGFQWIRLHYVNMNMFYYSNWCGYMEHSATLIHVKSDQHIQSGLDYCTDMTETVHFTSADHFYPLS